MHLLDAEDNIVLNYADAVKIRYIDFKFKTWEFEVISLAGNDKAARLTSVKNLNGYGFGVTYKTFSAAEILSSPALQWQKDAVVDSSNRKFAFNYKPLPLGGEYVISSITLPNNNVIQYDYTDTYLSKVTYPDGSFSTYSYSVASNGNTVYHVEETTGKVKDIHLSSNTLLISSHTGQILWNQNSMGAGTVIVNNEITYAYYQHPRVANYGYVYTGEGQMKFRHIDREARFLAKGFSVGSNYNSISGTKEKRYMKRSYQGPNGIEYPDVITNKNGDTSRYIYDNLNRLVLKSYSDSTFETWSWNNLNLETKYRDRLGRITLKNYDSRGNLLSRQVGILANANADYYTSNNLTQISGTIATQSSIACGGLPYKAIDGNTDGRYGARSVTHTKNENQPWWRVILVRPSTVNTVKIYNRRECPDRLTNFTVTLSHNGTQVYSQVFVDAVVSSGIVEINLPAETIADSVTVQLNGTNALSLAEVEVLGSDPVLDAQSSGDTTTSAYAVYTNEYYPRGHQNQFLLRYSFDANNNRTEFIYDATHHLTQINEPDDSGTGYHTKSTMTYNDAGLIASSTDARNRTTLFEYDQRERQIKTTYNDGSTELNIYGTALRADLIVKRKDRNGNVTKMEYDDAVRVTKKVTSYSTMNDDGTGETINPTSLQSVSEMTYLSGQSVPKTMTTDGDLTEYVYDRRLRVIQTIRHPDAHSTLITTKKYQDNKLFESVDPYGRKTYYLYRSADSARIRQVRGTTPAFSLTNYTAVARLRRDLSNNAQYLIMDYELDNEGQTIAVIDPRNIRREMEYDTRGRTTLQVQDAGGLNQTSETIYDPNSNVIEVRNPRYFSESINDRTTMAYTRRNLTASRTMAAGSTVEATESFTYYDDRRSKDYTDFRGNTSTTLWHLCCGRLQASIDQAGHQQASNTDFYGNVTHTAVISAAGNITNYHDLPNAETLQEMTNQYDSRHRLIARTMWLQPLGLVDPNNVPIATDPTQGLTTNYIYYDETTGHPELTPLLNELAAEGITFDANSNGSAIIVINPEGEVSLSISDGTGRTIASGAYDKQSWIDFNASSGSLNLVTWNTMLHDNVVDNLLETKSISALGFQNKVQTDGAGRRIKTIDAENNTSNFEYDANSNMVKSRDANAVGQDCLFDNLNRDTTCTDTKGDSTSRVYDLNNNVVTQTDAKLKVTTCIFDERNRRQSCTDRILGTTSTTFDDNNNELTTTDALNKVTAYEYDSRNLMVKTTYADHLASSSAGDTNYGITECSFDALRRKKVNTDQLGDTVTYLYDLASRMTDRQYRLAGSNLLESTDTFTYDNASRVLSASKGRYNNIISYTYDGIGRQENETTTVGGNSYTTTCTYDADNRMINCNYPAGNNLSKTYTSRNQLATVAFNAATVASQTYDPGMRKASRAFGNGLVTTKTYNLDNTTAGMSLAGKADLSFTYSYDVNKNVTSETSTGTAMDDYSFTASFDDIDRVTQWNRQGNSPAYNSQSWNLDKIGNWNSVTTDGNAETRTHNAAHELTGISGAPQDLEYDAKGNMTFNANGNVQVWDIDNHLKSVSNILPIATYTYDAMGRRLEKSVINQENTLFICHGQRVIEEYTATGSNPYSLARSYVHGSYVDDIICKVESDNTPLYYHCDRQYNVRGLTDANANIVELYAYTVYGKQTIVNPTTSLILQASSFNNLYGFTGRYLDTESDLWYFRARYFSDELGRFISRDPLGYVDGMSLYNGYFAQGFAMDPSGLKCEKELKAVQRISKDILKKRLKLKNILNEIKDRIEDLALDKLGQKHKIDAPGAPKKETRRGHWQLLNEKKALKARRTAELKVLIEQLAVAQAIYVACMAKKTLWEKCKKKLSNIPKNMMMIFIPHVDVQGIIDAGKPPGGDTI